ncbi:hypothetical protein SAMN06295912_14113 [Sphingomonas laterariae]|uniref:Tetratricopeptide repeat-containing protein n=1 Tax=Edaphosphingomonas laterariae TaxID=861865 RepID=A0A239JX07_9SPHN|nr:hypothetical protein [Sphingomonas laterariae]SNT10345.1 hypothetical protein SAMN06295912_14113 [Sphingomonas laterariae]
MAKPGFHKRRPHIEWVMRSGLAILAAALGYLGTSHSLAELTRRDHPERAYALSPNDGRITATLAARRFIDTPTAAENGELARRALRQDPTAVEAVVTLGLQALANGNADQAPRLFSYAQKLSRRNLQTQLWAIEDAVARDDVAAALRHYDIALRTSKSAPDILFPVLSSAIDDPMIRTQLIATLHQKPAWTATFIGYIAGNGVNAHSVASLFQGLHHTGFSVSPDAISVVINRLMSANATNEAWQYYASVHKGVDRRRSRDPNFTLNLSTPSTFDWRSNNSQGIITSIQADQHEGLFDFALPPSVGGVLLQQTQLLPSGPYKLEGVSSGIEQPASARPYWILTCLDERELGRVVLPNSSGGNGAFDGHFSVPADCPVQTLSLVARASNEITGVSGQIKRVQLSPDQPVKR